MKKIGKLKLNQIEKKEMGNREMNQLTGGESCGCGCHGSSSTTSNANANWNYSYSQSGGGNTQCASWGDSSWSDNF